MDRKTIGRYEIIDELGRGAMGSVLRARDPAMGRTVALKCVHSSALDGDQKKEFRDRFFREARAAGALAHPGIVPVFDVGEDDGAPFLVMELVQGRTLADAMKTGERHSVERVCEIGQQIADALGYAHRNGVVHRDIKPANILMTSREVYGAERPRITDFGVAKLAGGEITTTGQLLGTPAFMAPEQFTGEPVDGRADLFSLGVMLYRMATGEQPFGGETITAVSYKVVHTDPIPPSKLNPAIGQSLEAVLLKCLAKSPSDRYQTGEELAADIAAARPGAQAMGAYPAPQSFHAGADPGATMDMIPPQRTYSGQPAPPMQRTASKAAPVAQPQPIAKPVPPMPRAAEPPLAPARTFTPSPHASGATRTASGDGSTMSTLSRRKSRVTSEETNEKKRKKGAPILVWIIAAVVVLVGARYLLQLRLNPITQEIASDASTAGSSTAGSSSAMGAAPASSTPAQGNFNPRGLDPGRSGRVRLEFDSVPSAVMLTIEMDGSPYWSGEAGLSTDNRLVVPMGRHSFRIAVHGVGGAAPILSNSADADVTLRKGLMMTTEVRPQVAAGAGVLPRGTRIRLAIRADPASM